MQMVLVDRSSVPVSAVLYINLLVALTNSFIALITGGLYFCLSSLLVPRSITITATAALLLAYHIYLSVRPMAVIALTGAISRRGRT